MENINESIELLNKLINNKFLDAKKIEVNYNAIKKIILDKKRKQFFNFTTETETDTETETLIEDSITVSGINKIPSSLYNSHTNDNLKNTSNISNNSYTNNTNKEKHEIYSDI